MTERGVFQLKQMQVGKPNELKTVSDGTTLEEYKKQNGLVGVDVSVNAEAVAGDYVLKPNDKVLVRERFQAG